MLIHILRLCVKLNHFWAVFWKLDFTYLVSIPRRQMCGFNQIIWHGAPAWYLSLSPCILLYWLWSFLMPSSRFICESTWFWFITELFFVQLNPCHSFYIGLRISLGPLCWMSSLCCFSVACILWLVMPDLLAIPIPPVDTRFCAPISAHCGLAV